MAKHDKSKDMMPRNPCILPYYATAYDAAGNPVRAPLPRSKRHSDNVIVSATYVPGNRSRHNALMRLLVPPYHSFHAITTTRPEARSIALWNGTVPFMEPRGLVGVVDFSDDMADAWLDLFAEWNNLNHGTLPARRRAGRIDRRLGKAVFEPLHAALTALAEANEGFDASA